MRIETLKIGCWYRGIKLEGTCRIVWPSTYMITMEKPYNGLTKAEHFYLFRNESFETEQFRGRATWGLGRLYDQYQEIKYNYNRYKRLADEWTSYKQKLQSLKDEALAFQRTCGEMDGLFDIYFEALDADATECFDSLMKKHGIMPLSLSPSVLEISIKSVEEEFSVTNNCRQQ